MIHLVSCTRTSCCVAQSGTGDGASAPEPGAAAVPVAAVGAAGTAMTAATAAVSWPPTVSSSRRCMVKDTANLSTMAAMLSVFFVSSRKLPSVMASSFHEAVISRQMPKVAFLCTRLISDNRTATVAGDTPLPDPGVPDVMGAAVCRARVKGGLCEPTAALGRERKTRRAAWASTLPVAVDGSWAAQDAPTNFRPPPRALGRPLHQRG